MTLRQARCAYSKALIQCLAYADVLGLAFAFDQGKVPSEGSVHTPGSLHLVGLAMDILLYRDGVYLTETEDYRSLGEYWEQLGKTLDLPLVWGGRFSHPDGNHFSLRWNNKA